MNLYDINFLVTFFYKCFSHNYVNLLFLVNSNPLECQFKTFQKFMYKSTLFKIWSLIKPPKLMVEEIM